MRNIIGNFGHSRDVISNVPARRDRPDLRPTGEDMQYNNICYVYLGEKMSYIRNEIIDEEINNHYKPPIITASAQSLPFNNIGDRGFEILIYRIFKNTDYFKKQIQYDRVELMEGTADRGRDVCLIDEHNKVKGVIQCKNYQEKITKPKLIKEILKFLIFIIISDEEYSLSNYFIVSPSGINSKAKDLIRNFCQNIKVEPIEKYFNDLKEEFSSFEDLIYTNLKEKINEMLETISVTEINGIDLTEILYKYPDNLENHFKVVNVVSIKKNEEMLDNKLREFGLKTLTDNDLQLIQKRIGFLPENKRFRFMNVDFYGLPENLIVKNKSKMIPVIEKLIKVQGDLSKILLDYINNEIHDQIFNRITLPYLTTGKVHPFSVQVASPYIYKLSSTALLSKQIPIDLAKKMYSKILENREKLIEEIEREIFEVAKKSFQNDYSTLKGTEALIKYKINVLKTHLLKGFINIEDVEIQYKKDKETILPIMNEIYEYIYESIVSPLTIVLHEISVWEEPDFLNKVASDNKKLKDNT